MAKKKTQLPSESVVRKFDEVHDIEPGWKIDSDTGWQPVTKIMKTIPYPEWHLELDTGEAINGADEHIVFKDDYKEVFLKDLIKGDNVITRMGTGAVVECVDMNQLTPMYDIEVDSVDHRYYANGILHHNTTTAAAFLLWKAMFNPDTQILITANKFSQAMEIMDRIRYSYEECADHIRAGVTEYNKGTISFDNGSKITARATTSDAGRGLSITLLYCLAGNTIVRVRDKETLDEKDVTLADLHFELGNGDAFAL